MSLHHCATADCPYFGQITNKGCLCHKTDEQVLTEQRDGLLEALERARPYVLDHQDAQPNDETAEDLAAIEAAISKVAGADQ